MSCDASADDAADICKEAGEAIAADQGWELSEKISLSKLDDSELLASAQEGDAQVLVIRLKLHRSPGTEKRYAIELVGAAQSVKRTYGMAKVSQLEDELVRLGGVVLSTAMTAPEQAEDDAEDDSEDDAEDDAEDDSEEEAAEEPVEDEPAETEPVEEPAEDEAAEEPAESDEAAVAEDEAEEKIEEEETAAAPRNRMESDEDNEAPSDEEELAANGNQGKEDAVENEKENPGGIAGACASSSGQKRSRQKTAIPVLLTLLAFGQFVRRRAGSSRHN
ncbi:MAG: hypothetical protein ACLFVJ_05255 [Persicimonas sp.]